MTKPRRGLDGVLDAIEQLQGAALPASDLESRILPARVADYHVGDIDELCVAGEIVWRGVESIGTSDGRVALYLTDAATKLAVPPAAIDGDDALAQQLRELLGRHRGAQIEPLRRVATDALEERELRLVLDALGDDAEPQDPRHRDDGFDDRSRRVVGQHLRDERAVDLDRVDREALQIAQRRVASAEIVEREPHAELA